MLGSSTYFTNGADRGILAITMSTEHTRLDMGDKPESLPAPSGWEYLAESGRIRCAFATVKKIRMGLDAERKHESKIMWYVEQVADETFEAWKINPNNVPAGESEIIPLHRLINDFTPQLAYFEDVVLPAMNTLEETLDRGDALRGQGRYYSAEMEYGLALEVEEHSVRALFGLGLVYAGRRELERTRDLLAELVNVKSTFNNKNQHLFNEFGIALRKAGLFAEATAYYNRALEFVDNDENLYYNLARSHYENNDWEKCMEALMKSNLLNPDLEVANDLFQVTVGLADDDRLLARYGKPPVPKGVADRARKVMAAKRPMVTLDENPILHPREEAPPEASIADAELTAMEVPEADQAIQIGRARYGNIAVTEDELVEIDEADIEEVDGL